MRRLFALMLVVAFSFSIVSFAQETQKPVKAAKAKAEKVEVKAETAKKEVAPAAEKVAKHKVKKAAKKVDAAADKK